MTLEPSYDWIQTPQNIILIFYFDNINPDSISVACIDTNCVVKFESAGSLYEKHLKNLKNPLKYTSYDLTQKKLEIKLEKPTPSHWNNLFKIDFEKSKSQFNSKKFEFTDSDTENSSDEPFMKLLKQIYNDGDPETKKAMNKSFQTSGGKVLSTNWKAAADM